MIKNVINENVLNDMMDVIVSATNREFKEGKKLMRIKKNSLVSFVKLCGDG
jgi:hypothetical protein